MPQISLHWKRVILIVAIVAVICLGYYLLFPPSCPECGGSGLVACPQCEGTGQVSVPPATNDGTMDKIITLGKKLGDKVGEYGGKALDLGEKSLDYLGLDGKAMMDHVRPGKDDTTPSSTNNLLTCSQCDGKGQIPCPTHNRR